MARTFTSEEGLADQWSIRDDLVLAQSLISQAEQSILDRVELPEGLFHRLYTTIDSIEAEIIRCGPLHQVDENRIENLDSEIKGEMQMKDEENKSQATINSTTRYIDSKTLSGDGTSNEARRSILDALQDEIKAIQSVVYMHMNNFLPQEKRNTSDMARFSVLLEEMAILDRLLQLALSLYVPSQDVDGPVSVLKERLGALPDQLNALFNMEIQDAVKNDREISDQTMMRMVVQNQKRTDVLRHILLIADKIMHLPRET